MSRARIEARRLFGILRRILSQLQYNAIVLGKKLRYWRQIAIFKNVLVANLSLVFGDKLSRKSIRRIAQQNIKNYQITLGFLTFWESKTHYQQTEWVNFETIETVRKKYNSAIFCSIHFGNYYLFPFEIAKLGYEIIVVVGDQLKQIELIRIGASKLNLPITIVTSEKISLLKLIRELRAGKMVYLLIDEVGGALNNDKLLETTFLNQFLRFKKGVGALYYYTRIPIIPVVASIKGNNKNLIQVGNPLEFCNEFDNREMIIEEMVKALFSFFQEFVLKDPAQWQKWLDLKRFAVDGKCEASHKLGNETRAKRIKISKEQLKILKDQKGYVLIDMLKGRYFATDKAGYYAIKLLYNGGEYGMIAKKIKKKFGLSDALIDERIEKIMRLSSAEELP